MLKISAGGPTPAIFLTSRRLLMRPLGARRRVQAAACDFRARRKQYASGILFSARKKNRVKTLFPLRRGMGAVIVENACCPARHKDSGRGDVLWQMLLDKGK